MEKESDFVTQILQFVHKISIEIHSKTRYHIDKSNKEVLNMSNRPDIDDYIFADEDVHVSDR